MGTESIEQEAISFIFKVIFWIVTGVVSILVIFVWNIFNKVQDNKDKVTDIERDLLKKITDINLELAVNTKNDEHIDKELSEIKRWMESIDKKIDDLRK